MAIKRYISDADTTITNAFKENLTLRGTGSNMGASDVLETFSIYGQTSSSAGASSEISRILLKFPTTTISSDRTAGTIPASGSVNFFLKLANAEHHRTTPTEYIASILAVSQSWVEGYGLDLDNYRDNGEANWINRDTATTWGGGEAATEGGVYHTGSVPEAYSAEIRYTEVFGEDASQDLEVDITPLVEHWIAGTVANYGVGVMLSGSYEDGSALRSYYTKKFFSRTSEYFYKRPTIEARWNNSKTDDRSNFYASSSLVASENYNTLFLYNYARGQLADIPGLADGKIGIKLYRDALTDNVPETVHGGVCPLAPVGVYTASVAIDTSASVLYDVWYTGSTEFYTGTVAVKNFAATADNPNSLYVTSLPNLKPAYSTKETARFRFFTRKQNWSPTIYTTATAITNSEVVDSAYYKIFRISDGYEVIPYGTGSDQHTKMSYDQSGSYFDLDMSMLQTDYAYGLSVVYYLNGKYVEQSEIFKFRVEG